ncbi:unnamed protein product [Nesidiocoris tenuis]|uniref:Uncharacterized protein n=1 Tax=Nesidiocoris tenuis TaxID=355587 RepID=A0A6H5GEH9_9HEMI|nr:unnamed protein product [Nesidiocoris tenuis]
MNAGSQLQMAPQSGLLSAGQQAHSQDSNLSTGSSHSDKEVEAITPEKGGGTPRAGGVGAVERKRKRKTESSNSGSGAGGTEGAKSRGGGGPNPEKKTPSLEYFTKHPPGTSPIRLTASGAKSPSPAAQPYPMVCILENTISLGRRSGSVCSFDEFQP